MIRSTTRFVVVFGPGPWAQHKKENQEHSMPSFCEYRSCHKLASSSFQGYCTQEHMNRATDDEFIERHYELLKRLFPKLVKLFGTTV